VRVPARRVRAVDADDILRFSIWCDYGQRSARRGTQLILHRSSRGWVWSASRTATFNDPGAARAN